MRYVSARFENEMRELTYRIYVTDALKAIARADKRYADFWDKRTVDETRTADEIIGGISDKLKKLGGEHNDHAS